METLIITTAIIKREDKFLITKRAETKKFSPGQWEFISGFMDAPGSAEETILREIEEELGAKGQIIKGAAPFSFGDEEGEWVVIPFLVAVEPADIKINPADHSELKWVSGTELSEYPDLEPFLDNEGVRKLLK